MDLRALEARLENWARAQRSSGYAPGRATSAEGMYRSGYRESHPSAEIVDTLDALIVNKAWQRCMPLDKEVLRMHYIWRAPSSLICRRLKIPQGRKHVAAWEFALFHAQNAIGQQIDKIEGKFVNNPEIAYTPRQLMTDSVE